MTDNERAILSEAVDDHLDDAEQRFGKVRSLMEKAAKSLSKQRTPYPGVPFIVADRPVAKRYVVAVVDMRGSTRHLSEHVGDIGGIERVYYETSALLPATGILFGFSGGRIAEYTGDGLIAFFEVPNALEASDLLIAHARAEDALDLTQRIVNPKLERRYGLPALSIGVGLSIGMVMVTTIGTADDARITAFGQPVFDASKLSKGENKIALDRALEDAWPSSKGGKIAFTAVTIRGAFGYELHRSQ
jgi:class 3 adenylate cyclase